MMNSNGQCTKCGVTWDRRGVHCCSQQQPVVQRAIFAHVVQRGIDEEEVKERVKSILQGMVCKIVEHVPIQLDDRVEEIIDICRDMR